MVSYVADIKSDNVMVDYTSMPDGNVDIERVYLIDTESALPVKGEYYIYDVDIGHRFWRSPEAHARRMIGKPADMPAKERHVYRLLTIIPRLSTSCWEVNISSWTRVR